MSDQPNPNVADISELIENLQKVRYKKDADSIAIIDQNLSAIYELFFHGNKEYSISMDQCEELLTIVGNEINRNDTPNKEFERDKYENIAIELIKQVMSSEDRNKILGELNSAIYQNQPFVLKELTARITVKNDPVLFSKAFSMLRTSLTFKLSDSASPKTLFDALIIMIRTMRQDETNTQLNSLSNEALSEVLLLAFENKENDVAFQLSSLILENRKEGLAQSAFVNLLKNVRGPYSVLYAVGEFLKANKEGKITLNIKSVNPDIIAAALVLVKNDREITQNLIELIIKNNIEELNLSTFVALMKNGDTENLNKFISAYREGKILLNLNQVDDIKLREALEIACRRQDHQTISAFIEFTLATEKFKGSEFEDYTVQILLNESSKVPYGKEMNDVILKLIQAHIEKRISLTLGRINKEALKNIIIFSLALKPPQTAVVDALIKLAIDSNLRASDSVTADINDIFNTVSSLNYKPGITAILSVDLKRNSALSASKIKETLASSLISAIKEKDKEMVDIILKFVRNVNSPMLINFLFLKTVQEDNEEVVKSLIDAGANLYAIDESGNSALMNAQDPKIVKLLINQKADIYYFNPELKTALEMSEELSRNQNPPNSVNEKIKVLKLAGRHQNFLREWGTDKQLKEQYFSTGKMRGSKVRKFFDVPEKLSPARENHLKELADCIAEFSLLPTRDQLIKLYKLIGKLEVVLKDEQNRLPSRLDKMLKRLERELITLKPDILNQVIARAKIDGGQEYNQSKSATAAQTPPKSRFKNPFK